MTYTVANCKELETLYFHDCALGHISVDYADRLLRMLLRDRTGAPRELRMTFRLLSVGCLEPWGAGAYINSHEVSVRTEAGDECIAIDFLLNSGDRLSILAKEIEVRIMGERPVPAKSRAEHMSRHSELIRGLSWSENPETQRNATCALLQAADWDCRGCIDGTGKDIWENLVAVIRFRPYADKRTLLPELLSLLQDMNWPGADGARAILTGMEKEDVIPALQAALLQAHRANDDIWIENLRPLADRFALSGPRQNLPGTNRQPEGISAP